MKSSRIATLCLLAAVLASAPALRAEAQEGDRDRAESAAMGFLKAFDQGDLRPVYRERLTKSFQQAVGEEAFVAQFFITRSQLGGGSSARQLIDERPFTQLPNPPTQGTFYFFRYKSKYPAGNAYEDVTVQKEGDGAWKIVGAFFFPAPE